MRWVRGARAKIEAGLRSLLQPCQLRVVAEVVRVGHVHDATADGVAVPGIASDAGLNLSLISCTKTWVERIAIIG